MTAVVEVLDDSALVSSLLARALQKESSLEPQDLIAIGLASQGLGAATEEAARTAIRTLEFSKEEVMENEDDKLVFGTPLEWPWLSEALRLSLVLTSCCWVDTRSSVVVESSARVALSLSRLAVSSSIVDCRSSFVAASSERATSSCACCTAC